MKPSILSKLETLSERHEEVAAMLGDSETIANQNRFRDLSREYSELETVVRCFEKFQQTETDIQDASAMLKDGDAEMRAMA
ncbi:MAG: peptide chain release factor 1, partial [Halioglobus sp.]